MCVLILRTRNWQSFHEFVQQIDNSFIAQWELIVQVCSYVVKEDYFTLWDSDSDSDSFIDPKNSSATYPFQIYHHQNRLTTAQGMKDL